MQSLICRLRQILSMCKLKLSLSSVAMSTLSTNDTTWIKDMDFSEISQY